MRRDCSPPFIGATLVNKNITICPFTRQAEFTQWEGRSAGTCKRRQTDGREAGGSLTWTSALLCRMLSSFSLISCSTELFSLEDQHSRHEYLIRAETDGTASQPPPAAAAPDAGSRPCTIVCVSRCPSRGREAAAVGGAAHVQTAAEGGRVGDTERRGGGRRNGGGGASSAPLLSPSRLLRLPPPPPVSK